MIREIVTGFATTFKHIFRKPITVNYPDEKVPMFPKFRGKQVLMRDENGLEKCVACGLCAVACPADAIYLEAAENDGSVHGRSAVRQGLPDSQDALHLLRLLRRGVPGVGDLHGQGLRDRRLQQQGLHLGQDRHARAGSGGRQAPPGPARSHGKPHHLKPTFLDALDARVLVCDGAMGTMLYAKGVFVNRSFDALNLT